MSDIKPGDRVKAECTGVVRYVVDGKVWIMADDDEDRSLSWWPASGCTIIKPEFEWIELRDSSGTRRFELPGANVWPVVHAEKVAWLGRVPYVPRSFTEETCEPQPTPEAAKLWVEARLRERKAGK